MSNVLVVGGAGYIGSHITCELCEQGYKVTVLDNLSTGYIENVDKRAEFVNHSFANKHVIRKILKKTDCVIHLAALKKTGESMSNPLIYSKHNIIDSIILINECIRNNVSNFIFSSSAAVYGNSQYLPIDEEHDLKPLNYYGFTKLMIEKNLLWFSKLKNINFASLRYFNAAGYDMQNRIFGRDSAHTVYISRKKSVKTVKGQLGKKKETAREKMIGQTIGYRYDVNLLPDYKKLTPFLKKYIEHMGWDDLNWLEDVHMGYEEDRPAVFDRNANGWVTIPKKIKLPDNQQDRDMIARELLVKFQMSPNHPLVDLKKAYLKF